YRYQADSRRSFRAHLERNQSLARHSPSWPLRFHLHAHARFLAQPHRGLLFPSLPVRSCVTSGLHQSRNSRSASWLVSPMSIVTLSSTHGPTDSPRLPNMIRTKETLI